MQHTTELSASNLLTSRASLSALSNMHLFQMRESVPSLRRNRRNVLPRAHKTSVPLALKCVGHAPGRALITNRTVVQKSCGKLARMDATVVKLHSSVGTYTDSSQKATLRSDYQPTNLPRLEICLLIILQMATRHRVIDL
jgi:hypothetical protein